MSDGAFARVHERLDIRRAVARSSHSSDLLPPRFEDKVGGEVGRRFSDSLLHLMETGTYAPHTAHFVAVPKSGFTTRLAALMTLQDRAVYQALVETLRERMDRAVVGPDVLFGPRPLNGTRPWGDFERAPLEGQPTHIVKADIAGFYEVLPHEQLATALITATGQREIVAALAAFLTGVMGGNRGLPQGPVPSDFLATFYLAPLDREMIRQGWRYFRRGDDMRVSVDSFSEGRAAVAAIEEQLRRLRLMLNPTKSLVLREQTYRDRLEALDQARDEFRRRLGEERVTRLYEMDDEEIQEIAEEAGLEEIGWDLYAGGLTIDEIVEKLRPHLQPDDADVATAIFNDTIDYAPWASSPLNREIFHGRLTWSLTVLTAAHSPAALNHVRTILFRLPDETATVANYCAALASTASEQRMVETVEEYLLPERFRYPWQEGWLLQILQNSTRWLREEFVMFVRSVAEREAAEWFARIQATKLLARTGRLEQGLLDRLWQLAPSVFRPDLIAAANDMTAYSPWAVSVLEGFRGDAVHEVVMAHVTLRRPSP
ncbi:MAG: RNA-directed DNA polymerase [Actinomycetota bacterium]|nr:RNA-directed DNA polymerase [Actinomycetota bacterium]